MFKVVKLITFIFTILFVNSYSYADKPSDLIKEIVNKASTVLSSQISEPDKIKKLNEIAESSVDIRGIGYYTLGKHRKNLTEEQKNEYSELFKKYFLKSFSSRLVTYTDPIVNSVLVATEKRPEVKIDWRIYTKNPEKPLIRDLIVEGLSLARTQKEEFNSVIQNNNNDINFLFKTLQDFIDK